VQLDRNADISIFQPHLLIICADDAATLRQNISIFKEAFDAREQQLHIFGVCPLGPIFLNESFTARAVLSYEMVKRAGVGILKYYESKEYTTSSTSLEMCCPIENRNKGV